MPPCPVLHKILVFFKFKGYSWFKDSTHYYWPVPINYICFDKYKHTNNLTEMVTLHCLSFTSGEIFVKSKQATCVSKQKQNANLLKGDKGTIRKQTKNIQILLFYCDMGAFCIRRVSSLNITNRIYFQRIRKGKKRQTVTHKNINTSTLIFCLQKG